MPSSRPEKGRDFQSEATTEATSELTSENTDALAENSQPDTGTANFATFTGDQAEKLSAAFVAPAARSADMTAKVERIVKAQGAQDSGGDDDTTTLIVDAGAVLEAIAPGLRYIDAHPARPRAHNKSRLPRPRPRARARQSHRTRPGHRSCARSGDSGDDGGGGSSDDGSSGEAEPPPASPSAFAQLFGELAAGGVRQVLA